jgi:hypothetical protein
MRAPKIWAATEDEIHAVYPCDRLFERPQDSWYRAVTVRADRETVFRWLCQLKVAPYSFDLLDNRGRRSPRRLTPGAETLRDGERFMEIFTLAGHDRGRHLTLLIDDPGALRLFGDFAISYAVTDAGDGTTRLVAKLVLGDRTGFLGRWRIPVLSWGDLLMMHRQLHNLRRLAERSGTKPG